MPDFTIELKRILKDADFRFVRNGKSDHEIWYSPMQLSISRLILTSKSRQTVNEALKQAELLKRI